MEGQRSIVITGGAGHHMLTISTSMWPKMCVLLIFPLWQRQDENQQELSFLFFFFWKPIIYLWKNTCGQSLRFQSREIEPTAAKNIQQTNLHQPPDSHHHVSVCFRNHSLDWLNNLIYICNLFLMWGSDSSCLQAKHRYLGENKLLT